MARPRPLRPRAGRRGAARALRRTRAARTAQAQEIALVSNIGQGHDTNLNINPPDFEQFGVEIGENRGAQRFTTGSNPAGYTLQSVVLNLHTNRGTGSVVHVAIHDNGSSGNPGTLLAVLDNPADPIGNNAGTAGNRTFSAPNPLSLDADTRYWVMVSNTTTNNETNFDVSLTNSNNETSEHGFSIRNSRHQGTPGAWLESSTSQQRMEVRGTVVIPPGLEVTLHLSDNEPHEDLLPVTVTATASPASPVAFTVEISASPVAPATDDDFELSTNRTLSFAANATGSTGTVRIDPVSDEDPEPNDVVTVSGVVSNPAIPNPDDVTLTILNDDADLPQNIAIDAPAAVDEGAGTANVTVTLTTRQNTAPVIDAQLFYRQRPGTATRGDDYTRPQGLGNRIAIVPISEFSANADGTAWVARHSFEIGIVDDGEAEADETIVFEIYIISDNRGTEQTIVIRDDDRPPAVSIAAANPTVLEGQPAVFTLSRTGATGSALTATVALTEQADRDVLPDGAATQRTATFARGASTAALTVELENDDLTEPDGDLTAAVRAGAGYTVGDPSSATVTVEDDDGPTAPVIEDIDVVSTPRLRWRNSREEDTYGEGENIRIEVEFDQTVHVEGEPAMALEVGDPCISVCEARYESGSGTDTLVFAYLVLDVDLDRNGIALPANPVGASIDEFDGFSIRNDWDQEARLSYRREGTKRGHRVDGTRQAAQHLSVEDAEAREADGEMAFTVRLEPRGLGIVTVDYATRDGSGDTGAKAGEDYTETRGTLRFNPLETERTVTVPIIDDDEEDDGETFTLRLSNPQGARLRDGERAARGTIRNSDPEALSASFPASAFASASHGGADDRPQAVVAFSEPVAAFAADTPSVSVTGGTVASVQPHAEDGLENAWVFFLVPDGAGDVTFALVADAACAAGGICTPGGRTLTEVPAASTIPGPGEPEGPPLTASFEGLPEAHDGESAFTFRIAFSEPLSWMNGQRLREDVVAVSGGRTTSAGRVDRRRDLWEMTVEPESEADVTVTVEAGAACRTPAAVCTSDGRALSETISATVAGPADEAADEAAENTPAQGAPTIAGTPRVGETLTASTSDITDADGLDNAVFDYQWIHSGADIPGATGAVYTAVEADEGETLEVRVAFTDDAGHAESVTSVATDAVAARADGAAPLTGRFEGLPSEHDGGAFTFRIAFSEQVGWMNGRRLREDVVAVSGGRATAGDRVDRRRDLWEVTVAPDSEADVTVTVAAGAACRTPAAVCTSDGRALSETISATVAGPADEAAENTPAQGAPTIAGKAQVGETLTATTSDISDADGLDNATFNYQWIRDGADIPGAAGRTYTVAEADERERLKVRVTFTDDAGHGESLTSRSTSRVSARSLPKVSVADARVREAAGATLDFVVTLSAPPAGPVTVDYRTLDASATAGEDYEAAEGTLSFVAGETEKTLRVTVLDDAHDEGNETMVVVLDPGPGVARGDRLASGTIENSDPMPAAWLSRFGRTASDHVVEAIAERWRGGDAATPRTHFTLGGRPVGNLFGNGDAHGGIFNPAGAGDPALADESSWAQSDRLNTETPGSAGNPHAGSSPLSDGGMAPGSGSTGGSLATSAGGGHGDDPVAGRGPAGGQAARAALMNALGLPTGDLRAVLMGSSFFYSPPVDEAGQPGWLGQWSAWGRTAATRFSGADGKLALSGEVATAILGVDSRRDRWLAGVTLSYSEGEGAYTQPETSGGGVRSTLASLNPYVQYRFSERTHLWAAAGYGVGGLTLTPVGSESVIDTDLEHTMAAFGGRGVFSVRSSRFGAFEFAVRSDALVTNTVSAASDNLISAAGAASRVRVVLEGSGSLPLGSGGMLKPTLEAGLRYDGGDAETGAGLEIGGGLGYAAGALAVEVRARLLLAHQDTEYEEWGASGSVRYQPRSGGRGLSVNLGSTWGQAQSGVQSLWTRPDASGLAPVAAMHAAQRFQARFGYGFAGRRAGALWTPYAAIDTSGGRQALRLGVKLALGDNAEAGLEVGRRAGGRADGVEGPEHAVQLRGSIRW